MRPADLHTHTALCNHAAGKPEEYLKRAIELGLSFFGMSDHAPWPAGYDAQFRMNARQFPEYLGYVQQMKELAQGSGTEVLFGLETDYVPGKMAETAAEFAKYDFDYLLGSIHYIRDFAFDDPALIGLWEITPDRPAELWNAYLELLLEYIQYGGFQILAHPDLPKVFGYRPPDRKHLLEVYHTVFEVAAKKGIAVEINTAGLFKKAGEIYPAQDILKTAFECGCSITFGSDAHDPANVGRAFDLALAAAKNAGFRSALAFRKKQPVEIPFE